MKVVNGGNDATTSMMLEVCEVIRANLNVCDVSYPHIYRVKGS